MTMPPVADDPEASRPYFRRLRELAAEHGLDELSMGTSRTTASRPRRERRSCGSGLDPPRRRAGLIGTRIPRSWVSATSGTARSSTSASRRTRSGTTRAWQTNEQVEESYRRRDRQNVRRLPSTRRVGGVGVRGRAAAPAATALRASAASSAPAPAKVHLVGAARIQRRQADRRPLQGPDPGDHQPAERRHGALQATDRLRQRADVRARREHAARRRQGLPPDSRDVELSAEERVRAMERGGFYNQA